MGEVPYNSNLMTRYLLGDLSSAEQDQLEETFFIDNDLFIELLDVKDQLISDYQSGNLSPVDREHFERRFLTPPGCRWDVELARFLQSSGHWSLTERSDLDKQSGTWWQSGFGALRVPQPLAVLSTAALLILGGIGVWSVMQSSSKESQVDIGALSTPAPTGSAVVSLTLKPHLFRSEGAFQKVIVGPGTKLVELRLEVGDKKYPSYQARLWRVDDAETEVFADSTLKVEATRERNRIVIWKVPATKLASDDYQVKLNGVFADNSISSIGTYYFKVRDQ
jgi:hypothetical protein